MKSELNPSENTLSLNFIKESTGWHIDLPEWSGAKADLQMVAGADTFLDFLSDNGDKVNMLASTSNSFDYTGILKKIADKGEGGGADYDLMEYDKVIYPDGGHLMWLCDVTKFVFGQLPDTIYFKELN